jgi:hypothetical protein
MLFGTQIGGHKDLDYSMFPSYMVEVFLGTWRIIAASIISGSQPPGPSVAASKRVADFTKTHYNTLFPRNFYSPVGSSYIYLKFLLTSYY